MQELNETDDGRYPMLLLETEDGGAYEDGEDVRGVGWYELEYRVVD